MKEVPKNTPQKKGTITFRPGSREIVIREEVTDSPIEKIDDGDFVLPANVSTSRAVAAPPVEEASSILAHLPGALGHTDSGDVGGGKAI
jgi:hypothetical protein